MPRKIIGDPRSRPDSPSVCGPDQRKEPRLPVAGRVTIFVNDPVFTEIVGTLVDVSASGFRASHDHADLSKGQTVRFQHPDASGSARVIWNRITSDVIETGFLII